MLNGLIIFCGFYLVGEFLSGFFHLPVPGSVLGMLSLFIALTLRSQLPFLSKRSMLSSSALQKSAHQLLPYLPLFIVPASVGVVQYGDLLQAEGIVIFIAIALSLMAGIPVCGWVMQRVMGKQS